MSLRFKHAQCVVAGVSFLLENFDFKGFCYENCSAREKAMVINLEFIKAIVTAEEVLLLDPLSPEVIPFAEQLRRQIRPSSHELKIRVCGQRGGGGKEEGEEEEGEEEEEEELPFEFRVLEIALEFVCNYLESTAADLERNAYPVLDDLAMNVSTKNLERVRALKSNLTRLLARVQKVRDEIEHLLDDNEDMAQLYLTRKQIQGGGGSEAAAIVGRRSWSASWASDDGGGCGVEDLEMLLEAYFMQLEGTRGRMLSVREYVDDTEDYVNIQLDSHRNELIQLQLVLAIASFAVAVNTLVVGFFAMNIPCALFHTHHIFAPFTTGTSAASFLVFVLLLAYSRWKKLLGSS